MDSPFLNEVSRADQSARLIGRKRTIGQGGAPSCPVMEEGRDMDLLLINAHRYVPGYLPGSNLGENILLQLAWKNGYQADMVQDYVGNILRKLTELEEENSLPKVAGFYTDFNNITWTKKLIRYLKRKHPGIVVIVGGPQAAGLDGDFLRETKADALCPGEGEESLMELLDFYVRGRGSLYEIRGCGFLDKAGDYISVPQRIANKSLDDIPWPDLSLTPDYSRFIFPILTGRGCPMGCTFCYEGANARNVRFASPAAVLGEIRKRVESDPTLTYLNFLDDTFTLRADRVREICDGIKKMRQEHDFVWFASGHLQTVRKHPGLVRTMVDAGLKKLFFGFESGSDEMLIRYNKHTSRQLMLDTVAQCVDEGLHQIAGNFILGGPYESRRTLDETEEMVDRLFEIAPGQVDTSFFSFLPYPNTPITLDPDKYGMRIYEEYIDCCLEDIPLSCTEELSYQDLLHERLMTNNRLQRKMQQLYLDGKIPPEIILDTFYNQGRYGIYSKWMEYVYDRFPVDRNYWKMRAVDGYALYAQLKDPMEAFAVRTFGIWDYYDAEKKEILGSPVSPAQLELLKLCTGKLKTGRILSLLEEHGWSRDRTITELKEYEKRKWVLFIEI